ncbi:hypothetical protein GQ53DRAFT_643950 [Thozetella sp. PMI_491]|nr:hypothetical protein GQ53DRAFT_643950 [Thozetella sp. PMI_491]
MSENDHTSVQGDGEPAEGCYVVCIDYGTTYTGVGWILTGREAVDPSAIRVVRNWGPGAIGPKVPSLFTYSMNTGQKWGYGVGDNAYVIRWTKLELEQPSRLDALNALKNMVREASHLRFGQNGGPLTQIPRHLTRTSEDILTDYLTEVANCVRKDIESETDDQALAQMQFPMDFVITHPAIWDDQARNITFRAVNKAFRQVIPEIKIRPGAIRLATEPEACAQYTRHAAQLAGYIESGQLRAGECFLVVDAGGGTVDLVSYRIDQVSPEFRVTRITDPSCGAYGATIVDRFFLHRFLPLKLSPADYQTLLEMGGPLEQHGQGAHTVLRRGEQLLLREFEKIKRSFKGPPPPGVRDSYHVLDLPPEIGTQNDASRGIQDGQMFISTQDLQEMFRVSVEGITSLVQMQLYQVDRIGLRVRTIFLSGGFSENEYLFRRVNDLARAWDFTLLKGDDGRLGGQRGEGRHGDASWTAVAKGGVLLGLGIGCQIPAPVYECPYHIGVVVAERFTEYDYPGASRYEDTFDGSSRTRDHIEWLVEKGDLIDPSRPTTKEFKMVKKLTEGGARTGRVIIIYSTMDKGPGFSANYRSSNDGECSRASLTLS